PLEDVAGRPDAGHAVHPVGAVPAPDPCDQVPDAALQHDTLRLGLPRDLSVPAPVAQLDALVLPDGARGVPHQRRPTGLAEPARSDAGSAASTFSSAAAMTSPRPISPAGPGRPDRNSASASSRVRPVSRVRYPSTRRYPPPRPCSAYTGTPAADSASMSR